MEEIKSNLQNAEEVKAVKEPEVKEPTLEEYKEAYTKLAENFNAVYKQLQEANMFNVFKRLDYLFEVLKLKDSFDKEFVTSCKDEIKELMIIKNEAPKEDKPKEA